MRAANGAKLLGALVAVVCSLAPARARAQTAAEGASVEAATPLPPPPSPPPPPPPPPPSAPPATPPVAAGSDHDGLVRHFAVGYFGFSQLPIAVGAGPGNPVSQGTVAAPVVGARYWLTRRFGIDAGVGFGWTGGSESTSASGMTSMSGGTAGSIGFAGYLGAPIALASASHFVFEVVPETLLGFTSGTLPAAGGEPQQKMSGFRFDIGARIGAEIHFGFIGIPQLALQGSIGLYFSRQTYTWSETGASSSLATNTFTTSVQSDPWAIFADNISALYYF